MTPRYTCHLKVKSKVCDIDVVLPVYRGDVSDNRIIKGKDEET